MKPRRLRARPLLIAGSALLGGLLGCNTGAVTADLDGGINNDFKPFDLSPPPDVAYDMGNAFPFLDMTSLTDMASVNPSNDFMPLDLVGTADLTKPTDGNTD